jgi:hypothetical protein
VTRVVYAPYEHGLIATPQSATEFLTYGHTPSESPRPLLAALAMTSCGIATVHAVSEAGLVSGHDYILNFGRVLI